ncbi:hypothetical protein VH22019_00052 [Vibrio phage VH2_2019]|nr:hypothetical protein VH22019_00052 [Vibrio phage VH2_2019]
MSRRTILITFENVRVDKVVATLDDEGIMTLGGTATSVMIETCKDRDTLENIIHNINGGAWCNVEDISDDEDLIDSYL